MNNTQENVSIPDTDNIFLIRYKSYKSNPGLPGLYEYVNLLDLYRN